MSNDDIPTFVDEDFDLNTRQLQSLQQQINSYDEQLRTLENREHVLEEQRNLAAASLERKRSLLGNIRKMPVELLEKIFALYCHDKHEADRGNHGVYAPFTALSHTCSLWRQVAPHAWLTIMLDLDVEITSAHVHILTHHLSVVKKMPLTVDVRCFDYHKDRQNARLVFEMVLGCSAQWRSAQLIGSGCFSWLNERERRLSLGRLDSLTFQAWLPGVQECRELSVILKYATNLRQLEADTCDGVALAEICPPRTVSTVTVLKIPLYQLLDLEMVSSSSCLNLQRLHLDFQWEPSFPNPFTDQPINCLQSGLSHLHLHTLMEPDDLDLFKHLQLPRLETLDVKGNTDVDLKEPLKLAPLVSMLSRSNPPLQRLSLKDVRPHQGELLQILRRSSSITHLDVDMSEDDAMSDDCFLRLLLVDPKSITRPLLPSLSTLEVSLLRYFGYGQFTLLKAIANMLESRLTGFKAGRVVSLSFFSLKLGHEEVLSAPDVLERLAAMAD
ncbi:hypothetical protein D9758_005748 [Tetrapyrgos nigripes]|uniref:F-box domain-containing protein n=1 Tax=Tetrapyrgos nigripes TaxID=182062 RepID=A0A8H5LQZ0_9AGAR|nr:hypothetical protein D9758_005748 [Tetrapyrgos nigripes]